MMPKPMNMPPKINHCVWLLMSRLATSWASPSMLKVVEPVTQYRARKLTNMSAEPNRVKRKNLMAAYSRFSPPQTPIMKYIGRRTTSKKTKNSTRS